MYEFTYSRPATLAEAEALLRRLLEQLPDDPDALLTRGKLLLSRGDASLALDYIARALRINNPNKKAWGPIGKLMLKASAEAGEESLGIGGGARWERTLMVKFPKDEEGHARLALFHVGGREMWVLTNPVSLAGVGGR